MAFVPTTTYLQMSLADMLGTSTQKTLQHVEVILFNNNPALSNLTALSDLTQPTFDGYAAETVVWNTLSETSDLSVQVSSQVCVFQPTDVVTGMPDLINGYGLKLKHTVSGDSTALLGAEYFDSPIPLNSTLDAVQLVLQIQQPNQQVFGAVVEVP